MYEFGKADLYTRGPVGALFAAFLTGVLQSVAGLFH
jgi:hypothetical protein